jgi:branched-chain amino acid transport system permease protein
MVIYNEKTYSLIVNIFLQLTLNSIIAGATYTLIALGFNLVYGTVKFFDMGYGALIVVGGYATFYFFRILGLNLYASVILGVLMAGTVSYLINKLVYARLRKRRASPMISLVASLGVLASIQAIIAIFFTSQFRTLSFSKDGIYHIFGGTITHIQGLIFLLSAVVTLVLIVVLKGTRFGKSVRAINDDEEMSKVAGINTEKIISTIFFFSGAIAGIAGIMIGLDTGFEPGTGFSFLLKGLIAVIIGGVGNVYGGILGAFLLGFIENFGVWKISGEWKDAIACGILILFLLFRPQGILRK